MSRRQTSPKRKGEKKRSDGPRECRQKCSDCGRVQTISRVVEGRKIAVSRLWWSAERVSRGVAKRCKACLTQPRAPSWPPYLNGEAVPTENQRRLAIARDTSNADRNSDGSL